MNCNSFTFLLLDEIQCPFKWETDKKLGFKEASPPPKGRLPFRGDPLR